MTCLTKVNNWGVILRELGFAAAVALCVIAEEALANDNVAVVSGQVLAATEPQAKATPDLVVPALTPLVIRLEVDLGSRVSKTGDRFPLSLAEPVVIGGVTVLPAGLLGEGEVVHAKKSGGSGTAGELVVAARWLDVGGRRLRLRSFRLNAAEKDAITNKDNVKSAATAAIVVGFAGFLVKGKDSVHAKGELAEAKTAEAFIMNKPASSDVVSATIVQK